MEQQPKATEATESPEDEVVSLPPLTVLQSKTDDKLLELFSPDDASKSSFYSNRLTKEEQRNENIL